MLQYHLHASPLSQQLPTHHPLKLLSYPRCSPTLVVSQILASGVKPMFCSRRVEGRLCGRQYVCPAQRSAWHGDGHQPAGHPCLDLQLCPLVHVMSEGGRTRALQLTRGPGHEEVSARGDGHVVAGCVARNVGEGALVIGGTTAFKEVVPRQHLQRQSQFRATQPRQIGQHGKCCMRADGGRECMGT